MVKGGRSSVVLALLLTAGWGCVRNPLPPPRTELPRQVQQQSLLGAFEIMLELTEEVEQSALRRPPAAELVDVQISAMQRYVEAAAGRRLDAIAPPPSGSAPNARNEQALRLSSAALSLLPYLELDTADVQLTHVAARALAARLGPDGSFVPAVSRPPPHTTFSPELRDGIGVLRLRDVHDEMPDRLLSLLTAWSTLPSPPRAIVLDLSECEAGSVAGAAAVVNAFAAGRAAFGLEFRSRDGQGLRRRELRGEADWGGSELGKRPLFIWVSPRTHVLAEAAAIALVKHRQARVVGGLTAGSGQLKHEVALPGNARFAFTLADVLDSDGEPLRARPIVPEACPVVGQLQPLTDRSVAGYRQQCGRDDEAARLDAVLRYVSEQTPSVEGAKAATASEGGSEDT